MGLDFLWSLFFFLVIALLLLDFVIITKWNGVSEFKRSTIATSIIIGAAAFFAIVVGVECGYQYATLFTTGYLIELALSIDNIFVFILIFEHFKIPSSSQHRVLLIGVVSAIIMRFFMIIFGIALVSKFTWMFYLFGAFLVYSGYKIAFGREQDDSDAKSNKLVRLLKKYLPFTEELNGHNFTIIKNGKRYFTPLMLVLIFVEKADLIFALDSIPAILAITNDLFIVFTSNVFAILGLRSIYYVLSSFVHKFIYLKYALAFILSYIGVKMIASVQGFHVPIAFSLSVILISVIMAVSFSVLRKNK